MPTVILNTSETTFVSSAFPNTNFSTNPVIYAGLDATFQNTNSFLRFTLPSLPVSAVDSAILHLTVILKTGAAPSPIVVNRVTSSLDTETVTYNTQPAFTPTTTQVNITTADVLTTVQFDITELVNQWINGTYPNYGLALTNPDGATVVGFATNEILYEPYYPVLVLTYSETPVSTESYGYIYNTDSQSIETEDSISFSSNGALLGISHNVGTAPVTIESSGTYAIWFTINGQSANQFALYQNEALVPGSIYGTEGTSTGNTGIAMVNAAAGDVLTVRNHTSAGTVTLDNTAGGTQTNVSASILILRVGPATAPDPALAAVNAAQNITEIRAAIEDPALGLNLTAFNALGTTEQDAVLSQLLANRPSLGYPTVASVQDALDTAINELVDPNNIYVQAGQVGGNGSIAHPFGTISAGITAVNPGGTVHVLAGTYPITAQINFNKAGATLLGEPGTILLLQADLIPLLVTGNGATVEGLTITSNIPYAKEFIQIGASNVILIGNTIYGPSQALPMANWVVNRAVVSQGGLTGILLNGNTFYSLRTGMYINPNTTGAINNNVVYNTKGGFLVDGALTTFLGNSWGIPANEFDIVLLAGTTMGPPYDNLAALSAANDNATISDQR